MFNIPFLTSCNHCREKKRKCTGERPVCALCRAHGVPCEYRRSRRFRKRAQNTSLPLQNIMPAPVASPPDQRPHVGSGRAMPTTLPLPAAIPLKASPLDMPLNAHQSPPINAPPVLQTNGFVTSPNLLPITSAATTTIPQTLPTQVNALSRLLAGDMYPQTQQLPQHVLQSMNLYMSPFSTAQSQTIPEWVSQKKPEADIISNLENIASVYLSTPLVPSQQFFDTNNQGTLFENLTSQFVQQPTMFQQPQFQVSQQQQQQQQQNNSVPDVLQLAVSAPAVSPCINIPPFSNSRSFTGPGIYRPSPTESFNQQSPPMPIPQQDIITNSIGSLSANASPSSSISSAASNGMIRRNTGPKRHYSDLTAPISSKTKVSKHSTEPFHSSKSMLSADNKLADAINAYRTIDGRSKVSAAAGPYPAYPTSYIPPIFVVYANDFNGNVSPELLFKVMKEIYTKTRTSLVNVDIDLSWYMILKGIIPRIIIFSYIASMTRGHVIRHELMQQLPAKFDELCYEYAVKDVDLVAKSPSLWSALSLHLIARYEFQSARYDQMQLHFEMASQILSKTTFHGYAFPWHDVPEQEKYTFEYDYYVYTYWVGVQWHLVCCFNLDRPFNIDLSPSAIPVLCNPTGYFSSNLPCDFDLLTLLPKNSWCVTPQTKGLRKVRFRGQNDPEFEAWRPAEWKVISPNYHFAAEMHKMLPLGARLYQLQCGFCQGKLELPAYLREIKIQQERLKKWLYSLPKEFEITQEMVLRLMKATANESILNEDVNLVMSFKDLVMTIGFYHTLLIRANRVALLGMLGENLTAVSTTMHMRVFGIRDYFDAAAPNEDDNECTWEKNIAFNSCRAQCHESMSVLCDVLQLSFVIQLNLFTYGTTYVAIASEMLNVLISKLAVNDRHVKWKTKTQLGHVLCLLRSLQHWAPALYVFVYGIQSLSDPSMVLDIENNDDDIGSKDVGIAQESLPLQQQQQQQQQQVYVSSRSDDSLRSSSTAIATSSSPAQQQLGDNTGGSGQNTHDIPNPFPKNHIINLIVADLDLSLATFLAPAYPMLLLKIFAGDMQ